MSQPLVVVHERLGTWARQLRGRLAGRNAPKLVESRSTASLERAAAGMLAPIVVIDLADRPQPMLRDLVHIANVAPEGFFLVLNPQKLAGAAELAREFGATHVISGWAPPPDVANLIQTWLPLARTRTQRSGWSIPIEPEPEVWEKALITAPIVAPFMPDLPDQ